MTLQFSLPRPYWLLFLLCCGTDTWAAAPQVVVSIKPIHSLVAGVMQGVGEPVLLIDGRQSPHDFSLKPSHMQALRRARLIVWVGPGLEASLAHLLEKVPLEGHLLELTALAESPLLELRDGGEWESHAHAAAEHGPGEKTSVDSHLWLSPSIAARIATRVATTLAEIDPSHGAQYRENGRRLTERLQQLDIQLAATLAGVRERPYVVFHDAYHYFEQHYGLNAVGSVSIDPERPPGARRIHELRQKIALLGARCIFSEPQFEPRLVQTLAEGNDVKRGQLDPLGTDLPPGPEAYFLLMQGLARDLLSCLR